MKVLIIENNNYKLDDAIQIINTHEITEYIHMNNYVEAYRLLRRDIIDKINFIILDIQFYYNRPSNDSIDWLDPNAGYKFLLKLVSEGKSIPVFVFSSIDNFEEEYKKFLFPSFDEYKEKFISSPVYYRESYYTHKYPEEMKENKESYNKSLKFVFGHAHNKDELSILIKQYLDSNN